MKKEENLIFKDWGVYVNTSKLEQYKIKKVYIFKDQEIKIVANYFLDNFNDYKFTFYGVTERKLKKDLSNKNNFVIKSDEQDLWGDSTCYDLYINGDLNNYIFEKLELSGEQLEAIYYINDCKCSQCIGWNQKESNKAKYHDFQEAYKNINCYSIDNVDMLKHIKELEKAYKRYIKAKEIEKTYTAADYKKMSLSSGTALEENLLILQNNGFDVSGIKKEDQ